ncbi:hypothetical protein BGZ61DRAFT_185334 [Ilyonectria robusta]|uniref:uncharacterized protein n=1 Tax=Ilyonectria robusta TaxID=1079257 RepID=UPI001E8DCCDC|nr:uncharacterized protein BGZ61DRAFT_185334 [Ilyonectria robusta]KAH8729633.1 hypothetical protein BGZ61DRAFT_185334 [Ilyonectria robusta]
MRLARLFPRPSRLRSTSRASYPEGVQEPLRMRMRRPPPPLHRTRIDLAAIDFGDCVTGSRSNLQPTTPHRTHAPLICPNLPTREHCSQPLSLALPSAGRSTGISASCIVAFDKITILLDVVSNRRLSGPGRPDKVTLSRPGIAARKHTTVHPTKPNGHRIRSAAQSV